MRKDALNGAGTLDALGRVDCLQTRIEIMGTELLVATVTVALFGLCALFVRICDRI